MCQLFGKVTGVTPYPIQKTSSGDASWGTACLNVSKTKWTLKDPNETYQKDPNAPYYAPPQFRPPGVPGGPILSRQRP